MPTASDDELALVSDAQRRRALLMAGSSLLALGFVFQVPRIVSWSGMSDVISRPDEEFEIEVEPPIDDGIWSGEDNRYAGTRHKGEEGKMGKPSSRPRSGLYAMKGPKSATPQMHRAAMSKEDRSSAEDVWGGLSGTEVGEAYGVGGLGLVGTGRGGGGTGQGTIGLGNTGIIGKGGGGGHFLAAPMPGHGGTTHAVAPNAPNHSRFISVTHDARSTFSIDVDTASYTGTRRKLREYRQLPEPASVRVEEFINYFDYRYAPAEGSVPLSLGAEVGPCPWNGEHQLVRVGLAGRTIAANAMPPRNLVFLVDVSGSMQSPDKLPLVKHSLSQLARTLRAEDRISLVTYAGQAGVALPSTRGDKHAVILNAIEQLDSGGGTNGAAGIEQAYALAESHATAEGVNRVILATDGDFNVGVASHKALVKLIEHKRKSGVELSVLGYGVGHRDHTMEQLADHGNGNYAYVDSRAEARKVLVEEAGGTLVTVAKDVKLQVEFDPAKVSEYRLIGYDNRRLAHQDFDDDKKDAGEIGAGHTVTALYEVVPAPEASDDAPWMTLAVRYKAPKGQKSEKLTVPVVATARALEETTDDFRFAAAVASFGMRLRYGGESPQEAGAHQWGAMHELATGALGDDPSCRRHEFVSLVGIAAVASGASVPQWSNECTIDERPGKPADTEAEPVPDLLAPTDAPPPVRPAGVLLEAEEEGSSASDTVMEILRLLPPLLALPFFVMAWRRPRRRREG